MKLSGIYIHIPFCRSRCSYCDFATGAYEGALVERYVRAIAKEIASSPIEERVEVDTVYFGGGTPSLLTPSQVSTILESVHARFPVIREVETTIEINPGTADEVVAREYRRLGINRASFGAQSFDDEELRRLGRTHTAAEISGTLDILARAGFENINLDLIAGLPRQTLADWSRNLSEGLALRPQHLSLYLLEVHEATPLADQIRRGALPLPDEDLAGEMYEMMVDRVCRAGYEHYEISNFCLAGYESRHNTKYWTGAPVYGFGCAAHSYDGQSRRWSNERDTLRYVEMVEEDRSPVVERVALDAQAARSEHLFLGLRLMRGIDLKEHRERFGTDVREVFSEDLERLSGAGLIDLRDDLLRLTPRGALLSNEVFAAFI